MDISIAANYTVTVTPTADEVTLIKKESSDLGIEQKLLLLVIQACDTRRGTLDKKNNADAIIADANAAKLEALKVPALK